jgi:xanthine/CO dehydrogenase XdhC/CoxF family maturation factor
LELVTILLVAVVRPDLQEMPVMAEWAEEVVVHLELVEAALQELAVLIQVQTAELLHYQILLQTFRVDRVDRTQVVVVVVDQPELSLTMAAQVDQAL